jgi:uncharacterized LabA/DUF88 family protein
MKTIVYIDGLNLYYAALRGTTFKWLDLYVLFQDHVLGADSQVEVVRYYTAPSKRSSSDDPASPQRQHRYLRALKAHLGNRIDIIQGVIARSTPFLRLVNPPSDHPDHAKTRVFQFTEKKTDVNLASDLISDACHQRCEQAVLCSNDSDLVGALSVVRRDHPNVVTGLVAPVRDQRRICGDLRKAVTWYKALNPAHLANAQLPARILGTQLSCPDAWKQPSASIERRAQDTRPSSGRFNDTAPPAHPFPPKIDHSN